MECIHLHLGPNVLIKTRLNTNTQKNESVNRTLTKQTQSLELGGEHFLAGFTVACTCETVVFHPRYNPDVKLLLLTSTAVL